jgi:hypothetical protein
MGDSARRGQEEETPRGCGDRRVGTSEEQARSTMGNVAEGASGLQASGVSEA